MINREISESNLYLNQRVEKALEEINEKDDMLILQSREAALGEMMGFITHQWKQHLYAISLYIEALRNRLLAHGNPDLDFTFEPLRTIDGFISQMTATINDFRDLFSTAERSGVFNATRAI